VSPRGRKEEQNGEKRRKKKKRYMRLEAALITKSTN